MLDLQCGKFVPYKEFGRCRINKVGRNDVELIDSHGETHTAGYFEVLTLSLKPDPEYEDFTETNLHDLPWQRLRDEVCYRDGTWFKTAQYFSLIMTDRDARMMDFLINWQKTAGKGKEWFYCRTVDITRAMYIPPTTQSPIFRKLQEQGFIAVEMRGMPAKRWIKINYAYIVLRVAKRHDLWIKKYGKVGEPE